MGILDTMAMQQQQAQQPMQPQGAPQQGGEPGQMYQILMDNSMQAVAGSMEERIQQKGELEGTADLVAMAMVANLQAANQNGKAIPPQILMQVAKDVAVEILLQVGVPEEQINDVLIDVLLTAMEKFGDMSQGLLSPEEEQQYIDMINQVSQAAQQATGQQGNGQMMPQGAQ